jgi:hypothetical protein
LVLEFFFNKLLEKLPLCEKHPNEKSYLDILNRNQDINCIGHQESRAASLPRRTEDM